jgi:prepilin signal peptidase PulO-like enzyme (type II secretory pathway)
MGTGQALTMPARRRQDRRALWASAAAPLIAAVLILNIGRHTPILPSLVAGVGLAALAATDATSHRLPATQVRLLAGLTATSLIGGSWWHDEWSPLLRALVGAAVVALVLGALWLALPGAIAFGDVKVTVVAFAAAAAVSWHACALMIALACVISGFVAVIAKGTRRHLTSAQPTIPFVPGLALGFVVGVMVPW